MRLRILKSNSCRLGKDERINLYSCQNVTFLSLQVVSLSRALHTGAKAFENRTFLDKKDRQA